MESDKGCTNFPIYSSIFVYVRPYSSLWQKADFIFESGASLKAV